MRKIRTKWVRTESGWSYLYHVGDYREIVGRCYDRGVWAQWSSCTWTPSEADREHVSRGFRSMAANMRSHHREIAYFSDGHRPGDSNRGRRWRAWYAERKARYRGYPDDTSAGAEGSDV